MITLDTFYKEVHENFRDLNRKIDENHKEIEPKIRDLCDRVTKMETVNDDKIRASEKKYKNITVAFSIITSCSAIIAIVKTIF